MSDVIEICSVQVTIGNESIFVIRINWTPDKAVLPPFDTVLFDALTRFWVNDCVFLVGDF